MTYVSVNGRCYFTHIPAEQIHRENPHQQVGQLEIHTWELVKLDLNHGGTWLVWVDWGNGQPTPSTFKLEELAQIPGYDQEVIWDLKARSVQEARTHWESSARRGTLIYPVNAFSTVMLGK